MFSEFVDHYKTLLNIHYTDEESSKYNKAELNMEPKPLDFLFTHKNEIKQSILKLKNGKSAGSDLILNEFIKTNHNILLPTLTKLFDILLQNGKMPKEWNLSLITSLYKNGDPNNTNNYRGLSVTSCLGKLFTGLLQKRLDNYLESINLLSQYQCGFRKNHRTTDNIFVLKTLINIQQKKFICMFCGFFKSI